MLEYELLLRTGQKVWCVIYLVYAEPLAPGAAEAAGAPGQGYVWAPVTRAHCTKGCSGPILSAIQRFGKQGKVQGDGDRAAASTDAADGGERWKDTRHLFISIDEASNHVQPGPSACRQFRLLLGAYDEERNLLGTSLSSPIRVLANNDVPKGAARIEFDCSLSAGWAGWSTKPTERLQPKLPHLKRQAGGMESPTGAAAAAGQEAAAGAAPKAVEAPLSARRPARLSLDSTSRRRSIPTPRSGGAAAPGSARATTSPITPAVCDAPKAPGLTVQVDTPRVTDSSAQRLSPRSAAGELPSLPTPRARRDVGVATQWVSSVISEAIDRAGLPMCVAPAPSAAPPPAAPPRPRRPWR